MSIPRPPFWWSLALLPSDWNSAHERAVRQAAGIHCQRLDLDQGLVLPVCRVKMGRGVVVVEHADNNAQEAALEDGLLQVIAKAAHGLVHLGETLVFADVVRHEERGPHDRTFSRVGYRCHAG